MDTLTFSTGHLTDALSYADDLASAIGGTLGANAGWLILIATASLIVGFVMYLVRRVSRLGGGGGGGGFSGSYDGSGSGGAPSGITDADFLRAQIYAKGEQIEEQTARMRKQAKRYRSGRLSSEDREFWESL